MSKSEVDTLQSSQPERTRLALFEEIVGKLQTGQSVDLGQYEDEYPDSVEQLRRMMPTLEAMVELGESPAGEASPVRSEKRHLVDSLEAGVLGDFRILRQIGRGGMGVVYEAQQMSLRRRVALKVLPFAAVLDSRQLQRFKNESQAAASLRHPSIVQVFLVGCERAVHFYAMDFIEGQTLAQVIGELRQTSGRHRAERGSEDLTADHVSDVPQKASLLADTVRDPQAHVSTDGSIRSAEFFRAVARLWDRRIRCPQYQRIGGPRLGHALR